MSYKTINNGKLEISITVSTEIDFNSMLLCDLKDIHKEIVEIIERKSIEMQKQKEHDEFIRWERSRW